METAPSLRFLLCSHIRLELGLRLIQNVRQFLRAQADELLDEGVVLLHRALAHDELGELGLGQIPDRLLDLLRAGVLLGGKFGVCTVITVLVSGPIIQYVNNKAKQLLKL